MNNYILCSCMVFIFIVTSFLYPQSLKTEREGDLDLVRRETVVSEKIQSQLEDVLNNYYKKGTFIVNVKAHLERMAVMEKPKVEKEEIELPGLPVPPTEISKEVEEFVIERWLFTDKFRIKYIDVLILLDEKVFSKKDEEFVKTVARTRIGINEARGDTLSVKMLPFPPPLEALEFEREKMVAKESKETISGFHPALYFIMAILAVSLFIIIMLQIMNMVKSKKAVEELRHRLPAQLRGASEAAHLPILPSSQPMVGKETMEMFPVSKQERLQDTNNIFYELRQLMVTTLIGNPELSGEIFKRWVEIDGDNGIYQVAGFLKATDPKLIELLSEHIGHDTASKVEFAMNQLISVDKQGLIEIFKKFREEYQKEQLLKAERAALFGEEDIFHFLKQLSPEQIFHIIKDEPVSIMAIVLAQVSPEIAHSIIRDLPIEKQSKIPVEMGKLKKIPVSAYREIADRLVKKALEVEKIKYVTTDGVQALISLLEESTPEKEQEILSSIAEHDIALAEELRKVYITFGEIHRLPDRVLAEVLRGFDRDTIMKALIDTKPEFKTKILNNLPPRMKVIVSDGVKTLEETGEISIEEIQKARRTITQKIRELAKSGKIDLKKIF